MTTSTSALSQSRPLRDGLLAGLAGAFAPYLVAVAWSLLERAVWGPGLRLASFVDPFAGPPAGHTLLRLLLAAAAGFLLGAGLARALRPPRAGSWSVWLAFAAGAALSVAGWDPRGLIAPVVVLLIAASALGFRLGAGNRPGLA